MSSNREGTRNPRRFEEADNVKRLFAIGARASCLGIAVLDSQPRFAAVNASLAREMKAAPESHIGMTTREIVGSIASEVEPTYERVLSTRKPESLLAKGCIQDTPEFNYWFYYCFPITNGSDRVPNLGVLVVNISAEKASVAIVNSLATNTKRLRFDAAGLLDKFNESIRHYHCSVKESFGELACPFADAPRKVDQFRARIIRLDREISTMRDLIYEVIAHFSVPQC